MPRSKIEVLLEELLAEHGLDAYHLEYCEYEGLVRLSGRVPAWSQVVLAGHLAGRLKGVTGVVNEIIAAGDVRPPCPVRPGNPAVTGRADVVIIGAGVVGAAIARELSRFALEIVILEKDADVGCGASKANNGMVHSGIVQEPDSLRSRLNVRGNALYADLCRELDVPLRRCGLIGVVLKEEELFLLELLKARGETSGIPVEIISREQALALEPSLTPETRGAFLAPTTAMVSPYQLTVACTENAVANGAKLFLNAEVTALERRRGRLYKVVTTRGSFLTGFCINAAGVYADRVAAMAGPPEFTIHPRKGELLIFDVESADRHTAMAAGILSLGPDPYTKGGGISLTVDGNPEWGPTAVEVSDREDTAVTREGINRVLEKFNPLLPGFKASTALITYFAGIRAATYNEDFHIAPSRHLKGLINVAGIQSPGLAAAPAIAEMVVELLHDEGLPLYAKPSFNPHRRDLLRFKQLDRAQQNSLIRENPRYGCIVCRCEQVTEGEIIEALRRPVPALTLDAVKRRTRAGMGRCQGGFCTPRILPIMARELGLPLAKLTKSGPGAPLFSRATKEPPPSGREAWICD
jgi:glycerol-3-phosphate dehydrogenase